MSQNSFIKQYLAKQQELLRQRLEREAREAYETNGKFHKNPQLQLNKLLYTSRVIMQDIFLILFVFCKQSKRTTQKLITVPPALLKPRSVITFFSHLLQSVTYSYLFVWRLSVLHLLHI